MAKLYIVCFLCPRTCCANYRCHVSDCLLWCTYSGVS